MIRPTRFQAFALLAAGCALAAGAASTGPFLAKDQEVPPFRFRPVQPEPEPTASAGAAVASGGDGWAGFFAGLGRLLGTALQVALVVVATGLVAWGAWHVVRMLTRLARLRFAESEGRTTADGYDAGYESAADGDLRWRRRVADELNLLSADLDTAAEPREAVIACYVRMELVLADAGTPRGAAETPLELLARMLADHDVPEGDVRRLTELFTEARFSGHPVTDEMRAAAQRSLRNVADALAAGAPA